MSSSADLNLSEFLPYRLSVLSNTLSEKIATTYRKEFGLSLTQWRVLAIVKQYPGLTATYVSELTATDKVAVSRAVSTLISDGRVERRASPHDGRCSTLHLTLSGEKIYSVVAPIALELEKSLLVALSPDEQSKLDSLLKKLSNAASPHRPLW